MRRRRLTLARHIALTSRAMPQVTDSLGVVIATTHPSQEEGAVHRTVLATRGWASSVLLGYPNNSEVDLTYARKGD